jgi:hypothetical protein
MSCSPPDGLDSRAPVKAGKMPFVLLGSGRCRSCCWGREDAVRVVGRYRIGGEMLKAKFAFNPEPHRQAVPDSGIDDFTWVIGACVRTRATQPESGIGDGHRPTVIHRDHTAGGGGNRQYHSVSGLRRGNEHPGDGDRCRRRHDWCPFGCAGLSPMIDGLLSVSELIRGNCPSVG